MEQLVAGQENVERVQQHTVDQITPVPVRRIQEQVEENIVLKDTTTALAVCCETPRPVMKDTTPAPAILFIPVIQYVSENGDVAHAAPTPVTEYVAPALPGACAAQIPHDCLLERIGKQIVDTLAPPTMEEIVETVQILQYRFQQSIEEQIVDALLPQVMEEQFVAVRPTIATTDMNAWVENMC